MKKTLSRLLSAPRFTSTSKRSWIDLRMLRTRSGPSSSRMCRARVWAPNGCHAQLTGSPPADLGRADFGRPDLRLLEWPARCRQFDRDGGLDPRVAPTICSDVGRLL